MEASMNWWLWQKQVETVFMPTLQMRTLRQKKRINNMSTVKNYGVVELRSIPDEVSSRIYALPFFFLTLFMVFVALFIFSRMGIILYQFQELKWNPGGKSILFPGYSGIKSKKFYLLSSLGTPEERANYTRNFTEDAIECVQEPFVCNSFLFITTYYSHTWLKRELVTNNLANLKA